MSYFLQHLYIFKNNKINKFASLKIRNNHILI